METRFLLGQLTATPGALDRAAEHQLDIPRLLVRHQTGDWGDDMSATDRRLNDTALDAEERIVSVYGKGETCLWIITEADRSVTTVLRPEDY